ncbi:MAG: hypothetical protein Kow0069_28310 [Promethearchaeota archaeon]
MSEHRGSIALSRTSLKKNAVSASILVVALLVAYFTFSPLVNQLFGGSRDGIIPQKESEPLDWVDLDTTAIPLPEFPLPDFEGFDISKLDPDLLNQLMNFLSDPTQLSPALLAALAANEQLREQVVFRVYDYDFNEVPKDQIYWRHAAYDQYQLTEWGQSITSKTSRVQSSMITLDDFYVYGRDPLYRVKVPIGPTGSNEMVIPVQFPYRPGSGPNYVGSSISTTPVNQISYVEGREDAYGDASLYLEFSGTAQCNLTYQVFGTDPLSDSEIQSRVQGPSDIPSSVLSSYSNYLTFPNGKSAYYSSHPNFAAVVDEIQANWLTDTSSLYQIAYDVAKYFMTSGDYVLTTTFLSSQSSDMVEYFLQTKQGNPMDFASAFVLVCRYFDVPARFVSGYHSGLNSETFDPVEGENALPYRYMDLYTWAEAFMYLDDGTIEWKQFDLPRMSFSDVSAQVILKYNNATVAENFANATTNPISVYRGTQMTLSATVTINGQAGANRNIQFYDATSDATIAQTTTDVTGYASTTLSFDSSWKAGPHLISVSSGAAISNISIFTVVAPLTVTLDWLDPPQMDVSTSTTFEARARVQDPGYGTPSQNHVEGAHVALALNSSLSGPNFGAFDDVTATTNASGGAHWYTDLDSSVTSGQYEVYAYFTNLMDVQDPRTLQTYQVPVANPSSPSNALPFNVTDPTEETLWVTFNDQYAYPNNVLGYSPGQSLVIRGVYKVAGTPQASKRIDLYHVHPNATREFLGFAWTNSSGGVEFPAVNVSPQWIMGPHVFYLETYATSLRNGSFAVVVKPHEVRVDPEVISPYRPQLGYAVVNRQGSYNTTFNFWGAIWDPARGENVSRAEVYLYMQESSNPGVPVSYMNPDTPQTFTGLTVASTTGFFFPNVDIDDAAPIGYTDVYATMTGKFDVSNINGYLPNYGSNTYDCSSVLQNSSVASDGPLFIGDPTAGEVWFYVDGDDHNVDTLITRSSPVQLSAMVRQGPSAFPGATVEFYLIDPTADTRISLTSATDGDNDGYVQTSFSFASYRAGVYLLEALVAGKSWNNYSYVVMNEATTVQLSGGWLYSDGLNKTAPPTGNYNTTFSASGVVRDGGLSQDVRYAEVVVSLYELGNPRTRTYFSPDSPTTTSNAAGVWSFSNVGFDGPVGYYNVSFNFTGRYLLPAHYLSHHSHGGQSHVDVFTLTNPSVTNTSLFDLPVDDPGNETVTVELSINLGAWQGTSQIPNVGITSVDNVRVRVTYHRGLDKVQSVGGVTFNVEFRALNMSQAYFTTLVTASNGIAVTGTIPGAALSSGMYLVHVNSSNPYVSERGFHLFTREGPVSFVLPPGTINSGTDHEVFRGPSGSGGESIDSFGKLRFDGSWYPENVRVQVLLYNATVSPFDFSSYYLGGPGDKYVTTNATGGIYRTGQYLSSATVLRYYAHNYLFDSEFNTLAAWNGYQGVNSYLGGHITTNLKYGGFWQFFSQTAASDEFLVNSNDYIGLLSVGGTPTNCPGTVADYSTVTPVEIGNDSPVSFDVTLFQGIAPQAGKSVRVRDVDDGFSRGTTTNGAGQATISWTGGEVSTWRVGAHNFAFEWWSGSSWDPLNYTVLVVMGVPDGLIVSQPATDVSPTRGASITVSGTLSDNAVAIPYAGVQVKLFRGTSTTPTYTSGFAYTDASGAFSFNVPTNTGWLQGQYTVRVEFNFTFYYTESTTSNYRLTMTSPQGPAGNSTVTAAAGKVNLLAAASLLNLDYNPKSPVPGLDVVAVTGTVRWDNGSGLDFTGLDSGLRQHVVAKVYDGSHSLLYSEDASVSGNSADGSGGFTINIDWLWAGTFTIEVEFQPTPQTTWFVNGDTQEA